MEFTRSFQTALAISIIAHTTAILPLPGLNRLSENKKEKTLAVKYIRLPKEKREQIRLEAKTRERLLPIPEKAAVRPKLPAPALTDKEELFKKAGPGQSRTAQLNKPAVANSDVISIRKKISLPPVDLDKIDNPSYIGYYQLIREKIKRAAYQNYSRSDCGDVYISFVISSDGHLKNLILSGEKSSSNNYLKQIAVQSVKDASPFPNFPKELDYPQLSFNVIISFEIDG